MQYTEDKNAVREALQAVGYNGIAYAMSGSARSGGKTNVNCYGNPYSTNCNYTPKHSNSIGRAPPTADSSLAWFNGGSGGMRMISTKL